MPAQTLDPPTSESPLVFSVQESDSGRRIDALLAARVPGVGRKLAAHLCKSEAVHVNERPVQKSYPVRTGDRISLRVHSFGEATPAPELDLQVIFEGPSLVICEKPARIPSGAVLHKEAGTMAGVLLARYPEMASVGYGRHEPGLVHRLDNDTSGLLMAARTEEAFVELRQALSEGRILKKYLALVPPGVLGDHGVIESPLGHDPRNKKRVLVTDQGRPAKTTFSVLKRATAADLVELTVHAAFRHQIRVHLSQVGAPLLGDVLYGGASMLGLSRHALHASYIKGTGAITGDFEAASALPRDLELVLIEREAAPLR